MVTLLTDLAKLQEECCAEDQEKIGAMIQRWMSDPDFAAQYSRFLPGNAEEAAKHFLFGRGDSDSREQKTSYT